MSWRTQAEQLHWPAHVIDTFADNVARQQGEVLLVTENVLALRTGRGALQCTYRNHSASCLARAYRDTNHLVEWIKPPDPFCTVRDCKFRVPCPDHSRHAAVGSGR